SWRVWSTGREEGSGNQRVPRGGSGKCSFRRIQAPRSNDTSYGGTDEHLLWRHPPPGYPHYKEVRRLGPFVKGQRGIFFAPRSAGSGFVASLQRSEDSRE